MNIDINSKYNIHNINYNSHDERDADDDNDSDKGNDDDDNNNCNSNNNHHHYYQNTNNNCVNIRSQYADSRIYSLTLLPSLKPLCK